MKFFGFFIALCALCVLSASFPVDKSNDNSLIDLWNSSIGQKLVSSVDSKVLKRSKRNFINAGCPEKQFLFGNQCMTCEEYVIIVEDDNCPLDNEVK